MSDFIGDLEHELRAASTRKMRLAAARVPWPPATAVGVVLSVAVCIAVAGAVLLGHGGHAASGSGPSAPKHRITGRVPPGRVHNPIVADCLAHPNGLTGSYTVAELRHALSVMPAATKEYTSCPDVINRALLSAIGSPNGHSTGTRASSTQAPVHNPVVIDCLKHGSLTGSYTAAQLRHAFTAMPAAVRKYTNCANEITAVLHHRRP